MVLERADASTLGHLSTSNIEQVESGISLKRVVKQHNKLILDHSAGFGPCSLHTECPSNPSHDPVASSVRAFLGPFRAMATPADLEFMKVAIEAAKKGALEGGVPIGSCLVVDGKVLGSGS